MEIRMTVNSKRGGQGFSLIELTLVIAIILSLSTVIYMSMAGVTEWKLAKNAGEDLRVVYIAQKTYLADNPTADPAAFADTDLLPYLPPGIVANQAVEIIGGTTKPIDFTVMPPVLGSGFVDPSPSTDDGLWDVGKP